MQTENLFIRYATAGIVIWLMAHVLINIGMVLALLPVIGIPLPLVSYGGSSLVPELVALGDRVSAALGKARAVELTDEGAALDLGDAAVYARQQIEVARPTRRTSRQTSHILACLIEDRLAIDLA